MVRAGHLWSGRARVGAVALAGAAAACILAGAPASAAGAAPLWGWGGNGSSQLAFSGGSVSLPHQGGGSRTFTTLAAGTDFGVGLAGDGTVWAWGNDSSDQLGGGGSASATPKQVSIGGSAIAIAAGGEHGLAVRSDGTVMSWGSNAHGEAGDGSTSSGQGPTQVHVNAGQPLSGIVAVAAGAEHSYALDTGGHVWAWGLNQHGELADGSTNDSPWAKKSGVPQVRSIAAEVNGGLALQSNGTVLAWGLNAAGGAGNGNTSSGGCLCLTHPSVVQAQGRALSGVVAIAGGNERGIALVGGTPYAWGYNHEGELGDGSLDGGSCECQASALPVVVAAGQPLTGISAVVQSTGSVSAALGSGGSVFAWGLNDSGQLGNGSVGGTGCSCTDVAAQVHSPNGSTSLLDISAVAAGTGFIIAAGNPPATGGVLGPPPPTATPSAAPTARPTSRPTAAPTPMPATSAAIPAPVPPAPTPYTGAGAPLPPIPVSEAPGLISGSGVASHPVAWTTAVALVILGFATLTVLLTNQLVAASGVRQKRAASDGA